MDYWPKSGRRIAAPIWLVPVGVACHAAFGTFGTRANRTASCAAEVQERLHEAESTVKRLREQLSRQPPEDVMAALAEWERERAQVNAFSAVHCRARRSGPHAARCSLHGALCTMHGASCMLCAVLRVAGCLVCTMHVARCTLHVAAGFASCACRCASSGNGSAASSVRTWTR